MRSVWCNLSMARGYLPVVAPTWQYGLIIRNHAGSWSFAKHLAESHSLLYSNLGGLSSYSSLTKPNRLEFSTCTFMNENMFLKSSIMQNVMINHCLQRGYAKGKSKGKEKSSKGKGGGAGKLMKLSEEELNAVMDSEKFQQQLEGQIEQLKNDFVQQLGLRSSLGAFDSIMIDTADGKYPLIQLGQVSQKSQQSIVINMATSPQYISEVKTALMKSMGLNPQQDGTTLFVNVPKVTKEHRESLAKSAKSVAEKAKVKLRDIQNKQLHTLKKVKDKHSEDMVFSAQNYVQDEVKNYIEKIDSLTNAKQKELLGGK